MVVGPSNATLLAAPVDGFKNRSVLRTDVFTDEVFGTTVCCGTPTDGASPLRGGVWIPLRDGLHRHATRCAPQRDIWRRHIPRDRGCKPPAARWFPSSQSSPTHALRERGLRRPAHAATRLFVTAVSELDGLGNGWRAGEGLLDAVLSARPDPVKFVGTENTAATRAPLRNGLTGAIATMTLGTEPLAPGCGRCWFDRSRALHDARIWCCAQLTGCPEKLSDTPDRRRRERASLC